MGYNISEQSGNFTSTGGGFFDPDNWVGNFQMGDPSVTTITGDFNVTSGGGGEATGGYTFSPLSTTAWGTLTFNTTNGQFTFTVNKAALIGLDADQSVTFTVTGTSGGNSDTDTVTINILICVADGTLVDTPDGPRAVETLARGDLVMTRDNGPQPIRWIGNRRVDPSQMSRDPDLRPVRFLRGALGDDRPSQELRVSPQHRMVVGGWRAEILFAADEVLVPAKALVNDSTIRSEDGSDPVTYYHLMFDQHEIMITNGTPTESFYPGEWTLAAIDAQARSELFRLFPELEQRWDNYGAAARLGITPTEGRLLAERVSG